jgi:holin-like protein
MGAMLRGAFVLLLFLLGGEALSQLFHLPIPGSVLGMVAIALALNRGWVREATIDGPARLLVRGMGLLFVPAGVGIVAQGELLRTQWLPIVGACLISTVLVMATVALLQQRLERR